MSGQRRELETMMPLSMLKLSTGRPAIVQARIFTGSPRVAFRENVSEQGMLRAVQFECHSAVHS